MNNGDFNLIEPTDPCPKISVCITTYQSIDTLKKAIDCIAENYGNCEFCIIDNNSTDGTDIILDKMNYVDIKLKRAKVTRGMGRNLAVSLSSNEFILFIDADTIFKNIKKYLKKFMLFKYEKVLKIEGSNKGAWAAFCKKELFVRLGGFPNLNSSEDVYFFNLSKKLGIYEVLNATEGELYSIPLRYMSSGNEKRYSSNNLDLFKRYLVLYRDNLSCNRNLINFLSPKIRRKESVLKSLIYYFLALPLSFFTGVESIDQRYERITKENQKENKSNP